MSRWKVESIFAEGRDFHGDVLVGGFLNDCDLASSFEAAGYMWPTRKIGKTCMIWSFDHVFVRGLVPVGSPGKIDDNRGSSDHRPVWVSLALPGATSPRAPVVSRNRS